MSLFLERENVTQTLSDNITTYMMAIATVTDSGGATVFVSCLQMGKVASVLLKRGDRPKTSLEVEQGIVPRLVLFLGF